MEDRGLVKMGSIDMKDGLKSIKEMVMCMEG